MSEVCIAIRKDGVIDARIVHKSMACMVARADIYNGHGPLVDLWSQERVRTDVVAPFDYGLVIIDFDAKWAGGIQSYTEFTSALLCQTNTAATKKELQALWRQRRIEGFIGLKEITPITATSFEDFLREMRAEAKATKRLQSTSLSIRPFRGWTVSRYPENEKGWQDFASKLVDLGWEFPARARQKWVDYMASKDLHADPFAPLRAHEMADALSDHSQAMLPPSPRSRL